MSKSLVTPLPAGKAAITSLAQLEAVSPFSPRVTWGEFLDLLAEAKSVSVVFTAFYPSEPDRESAAALEITKDQARARAEWALSKGTAGQKVRVYAAAGTLFFGA